MASSQSERRSARNADAPRRVLDEATRQRRARKALESLEDDNFSSDPHADLVMSKKALTLFQEESNEQPSPEVTKKSKKRARASDFSKQRYRKNFQQLLEELPDEPNYMSAKAPRSILPKRHLCAVCGFISGYTCVVCGVKFCSVRCQETHMETRCVRWTA